MLLRTRVLAALALAAAGCDGGSGSGSPALGGAGGGDAPTWHQDVQPIVARSCERGHTPGAIGPFPLRTYEEARPHPVAMRIATASREMPPWLAGPDCNEYRHDPSLADEEIATIAAWSEAGAPEGTPTTPVPPTPGGTLERVDLELPMPEAYTPQLHPDDYRCFLLDWPATEKRYLTGFRAVPGAMHQVHHVIAYLVEPELVAEAEAVDAAEAGPGWTCFGGPGVGSGADAFRWLGTWAPGSSGGDFPEGSGLPIEAGSKIALQVHYNTHAGEPIPDTTKIQLKVDTAVEREALIVPFTNPIWLMGDAMSIPAGDASVRHGFATLLSLYASGIGGFRPTDPLLVYSAALHMHTLGASASLRIEGDTPACVLDIPRWDFHWQAVFELEEPLRVEPWQRLAIDCEWDNSAGNQPVIGGELQEPRDVTWGEGTRDEMCLGILYVTRAP